MANTFLWEVEAVGSRSREGGQRQCCIGDGKGIVKGVNSRVVGYAGKGAVFSRSFRTFYFGTKLEEIGTIYLISRYKWWFFNRGLNTLKKEINNWY